MVVETTNIVTMSEIVNHGLQKITKGTGIVFFGTIIGIGLGVIGRVLLARFFTQSEYGIYSLALVLLSIFVVISTLGLHEGATRQISYYRGRKDMSKVQGVITSSVQIALIASIFLSVILFFTSGIISTEIFHEPRLSIPLKIISIAIPFFVLIQMLTYIFRGFDEVKPHVYFQNILRSGLFLLLLVPVILLDLPFFSVMYALLASYILTFIAFAAYTTKKAPFPIKREAHLAINPGGKELLLFSLPLLGLFMINMILHWTDTLMLGHFKTAGDIGLYNAALPIAQVTGIITGSVGFIYVPIASQFYSKDLLQEMKINYQVLTKWIFSATLPLFLIFFLFPTVVLNFFFGSRYIGSNIALQILVIAFLIYAFLGPNGVTLLAMGKTRFLMYASLIGATLNIILNVALIPSWGIVGAASATTLSLGVTHIFNSVGLYRVSKIHSFTKHYVKPIFLSILLIIFIYAFVTNFFTVTFWMLPILFILFSTAYAFCLLLTKSFGPEDIMLLLAIEKRSGINATLIKRVLRRFV